MPCFSGCSEAAAASSPACLPPSQSLPQAALLMTCCMLACPAAFFPFATCSKSAHTHTQVLVEGKNSKVPCSGPGSSELVDVQNVLTWWSYYSSISKCILQIKHFSRVRFPLPNVSQSTSTFSRRPV
eukprot:1470068-Rhodomonas_salina.3